MNRGSDSSQQEFLRRQSCFEEIAQRAGVCRKIRRRMPDHTFQINLFPEQKQKLLIVDRGECVAVTHNFAYQFFKNCLNECKLAHQPPLLLDLAIMRLIEPASKWRSVELLSRYFGIKYSQRIYRTIPKLIIHKADIEQRAYSVA